MYEEFQVIPFNHNKPLPPNSEYRLSRILEDLSDELVMRPSDGTLLGLLRDNKFIAHDNDLDFDVLYAEHSDKVILDYAEKNRWVIGRKVVKNGLIQQLTFYDYDQIIYDFILWHDQVPFYVNYSEPGFIRIMPKQYMNELKIYTINELNMSIKVPLDSEGWLRYRYGPKWNVPDHEKVDWKTQCGDMISIA
jgi:hypothetical protein